VIPTSPDQFSREWLEQMLGAPGSTLADFSHVPLGTGQMCDSFRLTLDWEGYAGPASIVAKCPSKDEQSRNLAALLGGYAREVNWYRELAAQSGVACPHCYYADIADNRIDFALLLGDCAPARQGDQLAGAGDDILRPAIIQLAALHAPFWNKDIVAGHPWIAGDSRAIVVAALPSLADAFAERYAGRLAPEILELGRALAAHIEAYLDWPGCAKSVIHGDYRVDNLLIAPDGGVHVVDWQTVGVGSPIADLSYLIGTSFADPAARAAQEGALFEYYLAALRSHGVTTDHDAAWRDYRLYALSGFLMAIFASMNVERTTRGDEMFALMAERPALQAIQHGSITLIA
jgi:hypothetical protein